MQLTAFMLYCFFGLPCSIGVIEGEAKKENPKQGSQSPAVSPLCWGMTIFEYLQGALWMQPSSSGEFERMAVKWRQQGCSSPVTAVGREEDNGSTENLVATTGTAELSVVWTGLSSSPASHWSGAGSAAITSRSNEVAHLNQGGGSSYSQQRQEAEKSKSGQIVVVHSKDKRF